MTCVCCSNRTFVDGEDIVTVSNRALVACVNDGNKETGKVAIGKVEVRVTLTIETARELIADLQAQFGIVG